MSDYPVIFLRPEPYFFQPYYRRLEQKCANCDRAAENVQPWISNAKLNKFSATKYFLLCTSFHAFGIGLNPVVVDFQIMLDIGRFSSKLDINGQRGWAYLRPL
ncbi:Lysophosphatidic acid phosphatase type [Trichinella spiralis]|uniref:Lysophosphatidic acid phosphatase type n=1 Tax=Trichinella spiralis TaxID=6334 RepID=A0ABR3KGP7_TRISP